MFRSRTANRFASAARDLCLRSRAVAFLGFAGPSFGARGAVERFVQRDPSWRFRRASFSASSARALCARSMCTRSK